VWASGLHHVLAALTGTWVIPHRGIADGLATASVVLGPDRAQGGRECPGPGMRNHGSAAAEQRVCEMYRASCTLPG
jgi:hypothetical protein